MKAKNKKNTAFDTHGPPQSNTQKVKFRQTTNTSD